MMDKEDFQHVLERLKEIGRLAYEVLDITRSDSILGDRISDENNSLRTIIQCVRDVEAGALREAYLRELIVF